MCKRTDPNPCQHQRMRSEPVNAPVQGGAPQQRRPSAARLNTNSGKKARAQRNEQNNTQRSGAPLQEHNSQQHPNTQKQAASKAQTAAPRGPSPRGNKRPCHSPNAGLPNASRGIRVASPSKGSNGTAAASNADSTVYAGAKFNDPPSPAVLPKPPMHWVISGVGSKGDPRKSCTEMTNILKVMLNVQA